MSIVQLASGGTAQAPSGAIAVKLSTAAQAELVLMRADGQIVEPDFRKSPTEVVLVPREDIVVTARSGLDQPFPPGVRVGVSFRSASGAGVEIVRPAAEVGGHQSVMLARVGADGIIQDGLGGGRSAAGEGIFSRQWLRAGSYAYHVNHQQRLARELSWSLVVDASAALLSGNRRKDLGQFLEILIGIVATAYSSEPRALLVAADPVREAVSCLDEETIDWLKALGTEPAAWPRVTQAVRAGASADAVVVVLGGVPVDYRELTAWAAEADKQVLIVAVGRSRLAARAQERPTQFWEEELSALDELAALPRVRVVSVMELAAAAESAQDLADALFLVGDRS